MTTERDHESPPRYWPGELPSSGPGNWEWGVWFDQPDNWANEELCVEAGFPDHESAQQRASEINANPDEARRIARENNWPRG